MKRSGIAQLAAILLLASSCGKVGAPLPPIIRTPQPAANLSATQNAYNIVLTWTNPARYIDGNPATDLSKIRILRNGVDIASVAAGAAGQPQSFLIDASDSLGTQQAFSVRVESLKGAVSAVSNAFVFQPVEVPGPVLELKALPDQFKIRVYWQFPARNASLAESYIVRRSDGSAPPPLTDLFFDDTEVEQGKTYSYTVTAALGQDGRIPGPAEAVTVLNEDKSAPQTPVGLAVEPDAAGGVFLTWIDNTEADLAGYQIYRSDRSDGVFALQNPMPWTPNGFFDKDYRPGLFYKISALDFFGNESPQSPPQRGP